MKKYHLSLSLTICILTLSFPVRTQAAGLNCFLDIITESGEVTGWALDQSLATWTTGPFAEVEFFIDGPKETGKNVGTTTANVAIWTTHSFSHKIPELLDGKPHTVFAYALDSSGNPTVHCQASHQTFPMQVTSAYYHAPNFPDSSGWAADNTNYFQQWSCSSTTGIDSIRKMDIAPLGKHDPYFWKDSTFVNFREMSGGNPVVYFTGSLRAAGAKFALKKAAYNAGLKKWEISDVLNHPTPKLGGVSSQDGIGNDFIMNDYLAPGWGPTANKPGSQSKIPGVSETPIVSGFSSYPLTGTGPLGLTTILSTNQSPNSNPPKRCMHMNPTLFDFDANGVPRAFVAGLWNYAKGTGSPCTLPAGAPILELPDAGEYIYRYKGAQLGWQLDLSNGSLLNYSQTSSAINYIYGSNNIFLKAEWDGIINTVDLNLPRSSREKTVLDCSEGDIFWGEPTGRANQIYFIATTLPAGPDVGLADDMFIHDIFYAYDSTPTVNSVPGDLNSDNLVNLADYNLLVASFGTKYTLADYNNLVANFGK